MISPSQLLARHRLFDGLPGAEIDRLATACEARRRPAGATLFLKDDPGDGIYGILSGEIEISTSSAAGKEVVVATLRQGDIFGEIAVFDGRGRSASAAAKTDAHLFFVSKHNFLEFAASHPPLLLRMIEVLCERLRRTTVSLEDNVFLDVAGRVAKRIVAALPDSAAIGGSATIRITQAALARDVGASREIVSRQLQVWKKEKLIDIGRSTLTIPDMRRFRSRLGA
jgi:CRP-like cAMP-binding protein